MRIISDSDSTNAMCIHWAATCYCNMCRKILLLVVSTFSIRKGWIDCEGVDSTVDLKVSPVEYEPVNTRLSKIHMIASSECMAPIRTRALRLDAQRTCAEIYIRPTSITYPLISF